MDFGVASGVMEKAEKGSGGGSGSSMLKGISFGAYSSFVWFFEEGASPSHLAIGDSTFARF